MSAYYPVHVDIKSRKCVVVGGGAVASRKVRSLLECGARVTVIGPQPSPDLQELALRGAIDVVRREFREGDVAGSFLVIAATDDEAVNDAVAREAERNNALVNVVDDPQRCNFLVPSVVRRGDLVVSISTGGRSPALARSLRQRIEQFLEPEYGLLLDVVSEVRDELKRDGRSVAPDAWQEALDSESLELVRLGLTDRAKERIIRVLLGPDETELAEKRQFVDNSHAKSRLSPISTGGNEQ